MVSPRVCSRHLLKSIGVMEEVAGLKNHEILASGLRSLPGAVYVVKGVSDSPAQSFAPLASI